MIKAIGKALMNVIEFTGIAVFILFALALYSPTKAVYVLNISVAYLYVLVVTCGNFVIMNAVELLNLLKSGVA